MSAVFYIFRCLLTGILLFCMTSGCISNLEKEGSPCPCGAGWTCCEVDGVCIPKGDMCLTEDQRLLLVLEGTWIGSASEAHTMSGTDRIVMEMTLPATGEPAVEGLTGGIWFGEELDTSPADPDFPRIDENHSYYEIRDGFIFSLLNMAILDGRLLAEFNTDEQWTDFCEAQTETYSLGNELYTCKPTGTGWWGEEGEGPNGEQGTIYHGPNGEEVFISLGKEELCLYVCKCDSSGCTVDISQGPYAGNLDLSIDVDRGILLGTSNEGQIEAEKQ